MEIRKYNLQNDFEKGQGSLGPYMEFVNIFNAFSESHLHKFSEISVGAWLRFVKCFLRFQQITLHKFKIHNRFFKMPILKTNIHFQDFSKSTYSQPQPSSTYLGEVKIAFIIA